MGQRAYAFDKLSPRQRQVASMLGRGMTNIEIAGILDLSPHTVRHHTEAVFRKLGVRNRASVAHAVTRMASRR